MIAGVTDPWNYNAPPTCGALPFPKSRKMSTKAANNPEITTLLNLLEEAYRQNMATAHAEATLGTAPQPWDADWCENALDIWEETEVLVKKWSWQHVQILQEILDMALASPQGQKAQSLAHEVNNPWRDALRMIEGMKQALTSRSHSLLRKQGKELGNSQGRQFELEVALDELLHPDEV